jgi:hypothetical protein
VVDSLADLGKWLLYTAMGLLTAYLLWKNREQLRTVLQNFGQWLIDFWHRLFGGKTAKAAPDAEQAARPAAPLPRFADFTDPFAAGVAARWTPEQLVRYTFEAMEAWSRDHGQPRDPEQTPHEFARLVAAQVPDLTDDAQRLAELYCQAAYAHASLPPAGVARLSRLWQGLRNYQRPERAAAISS